MKGSGIRLDYRVSRSALHYKESTIPIAAAFIIGFSIRAYEAATSGTFSKFKLPISC